VVIFSKSYCPFCQRANKALHEIGVAPVVIELDERPDGRAMQIALLQMTEQRTVPNVWLNGKHIGGSDDTVAAIRNGLFHDLDKTAAKEFAEYSGIKNCKEADDALPCLCQEANC
jgi:glutaredoxin 3